MKAVVSVILMSLVCSRDVWGRAIKEQETTKMIDETGLTVLENEFREMAGDGNYEFK